MCFDYKQIPLLEAVYNLININDVILKYDGNDITLDGLARHSIITLPPQGWINYLKA